MAVWSIDIKPGNPATFVAQIQNAPPGTLYADPGDLVSWNNMTNQTHDISVFAGSGVSGVVTPNHQTAAYTVSDGATTYTCTRHPNEKGVILAGSANRPPQA